MELPENLAYTFEGKYRPIRLLGNSFPVKSFLVFDSTDDLVSKAKELLDYAAQDNKDFIITDKLRDLIKNRPDLIQYKIFRINNRRLVICRFNSKNPVRKITRNGKIAIVVHNNGYIGYID